MSIPVNGSHIPKTGVNSTRTLKSVKVRSCATASLFLVEPVEGQEKMPGWFYAHVPSLGVTTHGKGIEGALDAARDVIHLWVEEKKAAGEISTPARESLLAMVEVD